MSQIFGSISTSEVEVIQMVNVIIRSFSRSLLLSAIMAEMTEMSTRVSLTRRVVENHTPSQAHVGLNKLKIQKHKPLNGNRDAKELKNFIFDVEQYLKVTGTCSQDLRVTLVAMHLMDDAKLWWRSNVNSIKNGSCTINSWEDY